MSRASARALKEFHERAHKAGWHLPPDDAKKAEHLEDVKRELYQNPTTGRNTKLGRKVEKPGIGRQSGPSGQTDSVQHDRKHTNK